MAVTYVNYATDVVHGATAARGAAKVIEGLNDILRAYGAAVVATDGGTTKDNLIGGDFGAADSANALLFWDALYGVDYILANDATGFLAKLAALDKGVSG